MHRGLPPHALFPYTTLFRSSWQTARTYDAGRGSPEAWIVMRARSRAIDRVRSMRRRGETFLIPLDESAATAAPESQEDRSEEHTSELESHSDLVCRLLLEKK